jgi:hypothetical protein
MGCDSVNEDKPFQIQRWLFFREGSGDIASVCPAHGRFLLRGNVLCMEDSAHGTPL